MDAMQANIDENNKDYLDMLNDTSARQAYFSKLSVADANDHSEVAAVKRRINKLIQEEIELSGLQGQIS